MSGRSQSLAAIMSFGSVQVNESYKRTFLDLNEDEKEAVITLANMKYAPMPGTGNLLVVLEAVTLSEARACEETARAALELNDNGVARLGKRPHDSDVEVERGLEAQSPKRTCVPALSVDFRGPNSVASSSKSTTGLKSAPAKQRYLRTPLPTCRSRVETDLPITKRIQESTEGSTFSQNYSHRRGWTPINHVPQGMIRAEDDLKIPINSIISALDVSADIRDRRTTSAPASFSNKRSPTAPLPSKSFMRATTHPITHGVAIKASDPSSTTAGSSRPRDKLVEINARSTSNDDGPSNEDTGSPSSEVNYPSTDVNVSTSPIRREKWKGKSFATLILEALRAATSTDHKLTTNQITAYIEKYRLTTDMKFPALPQTIRAAVLKKSRHQRKNGSWYPGLWVHCPEPGKRIGPYKLLPEGFAEDAVVPEDEEGL